MVTEQNVLEYIKSSKFLDASIRDSLIEYFDTLNRFQIVGLVSYFNNQKQEILKILIELKNIDVCSFEEIKTTIDGLKRRKLKNEEILEYENEQTEILNLIHAFE